MKKFILVIAAAAFLGCNREKENTQLINPGGMELSVQPGGHWLEKVKLFFIFYRDRTPQMAAWIEDDQGKYISTITVTNKNAKKKWSFAPKEGRPEALPVWNNAIKNDSTQVDSVSAATSKVAVDVQVNDGSLINGHKYNVYLEINHSFDYNDIWTKDNSGVNGQPSLIYHGKFIAGTSGKIPLNPIGYGSVDGSDGNIVNTLNGITTALTIVSEAYIIAK